MQKIFSTNTILWTLIIAVIVLATGLLFKPGLPAGHDTFAHATYSKIFFQAISQGQFPVRWVEHAWIGFGQPLFNYYQVGFFYLVSLVQLFIPSLTIAVKASVMFIWFLGSIFIYLFTKKYGKIPATLAFVVYAFSPYILLDIFVRSSFPELTALSLVPGIFWAVDQIIHTKKPIYIAVLATLLAATFVSHLPTVVLFSPLITIYTLYNLIAQRASLKTFYYLCTAVLLGVGISAFYVLPAVTELKLIQIEKMQSGQFNFNVNFVQPNNIFSYIWGYNGTWWGTTTTYSYLIGTTPWIIFATSIAYLLTLAIKHRKNSYDALFWLFCIVYAGFFMHQISAPVWNAIPIFDFFQFPWRFFMLIPISTAVLSALLLARIKNSYRQLSITIGAFIITTFTTVPYIYAQQFVTVDYFNLPFTQWRQHPEAQYVAFWEPGYSPVGVDYVPQKLEFTNIWSFSGEGTVTEQSVKTHEIIVTINATDQSTFTLNKPYFKYWQAKLNNESVPITPADPYNFMNIHIPAGHHTLAVVFAPPAIINTAQTISLGSLLSMLLAVLLQHPYKKYTVRQIR